MGRMHSKGYTPPRAAPAAPLPFVWPHAPAAPQRACSFSLRPCIRPLTTAALAWPRRKGMSASAIPYRRAAPGWLKREASDVCDQICKLAKKGLTPSQIGVILRDSHGIAQVRSVTGNKVLRILKGNGAPPDPAAVLPAPLCPSGRTSSPGQCASAAPGRRRRGQQRPATAASSRSRSRAADVVLSRFFGCSAGRTRP
jgi:hypothetical protein